MASVRGGLFEEEPVQRSSRPGTGLAALFSNNSPQTSNVDLAYKPQKQPQPQPQPQPQSESPSVIFGVTVQLFQFDPTANKFVLKGKVGAAILGSRSYQLLLYQNNRQQISVTTLSADFTYTIQNNVYGTYYDDSRQSWSLLFKDQAECNKFASYVAIAKAAAGGFGSVKFQEILVGPKGKGVSAGDSIGVKYSGWLIDEHLHMGALFDSNAEKDGFFKFVVGEGKVIRGWEEGVIGMKKGGKRLVAIPSHLAYGKNGYAPAIPPNSNLLFEIEIVRMKRGNGGVDEPASGLPSLDTSLESEPALLQNQGGPKSDLVARMAKVGRPAMGAVMTKSKQEEEGMIPQREFESSDNAQGLMASLPMENPHHQIQQMQQLSQQQLQLQQQQQQLSQQQFLQQAQFGAVQQFPAQQAQPNVNSYQFSVTPQTGYPQFSQYPQTQVQPQVQTPVATPVNSSRAASLSNSDALQFLLEERQFQSEIKNSLNQVLSKVDDVHSKIESSAFFGKGKGQTKSDDYMSGLVIIQNVHRVVDENEKLRTELNQKGEVVDSLRTKIATLLEKNEKLIQENTRLLEQRTDSLKESSTQSHKQIQDLLDAKKKLEKELNEVQVQSAEIESKYLALNRNVNAMKQELESAREDIAKKTNEVELLKSKEISSESTVKKLTQKLEEETTLRKSLQEANQALKDQLGDQEENISRLKKDKEKEKSKFASTEAKFKEKKAALKTQIAQLQQALKTEGMNKEEIEKMEQDFRNKLKKQEVEIATRVRQEIESIDKPNWEFHAFNKGKLEGTQQGVLQGVQQAQADTELRTQTIRDQAFKEGKEAGYAQARLDLSSSTVVNPKQVEESYQRGYSQGKQDGFISGKQSGFNDGLAQGKQLSGSGNADVHKILQEAKKDKDETVKKVMNSVYFALYEEIDEDESYAGSQVLQLMMQTIKAKTLEMIQQEKQGEQQSTEPVETETSETESPEESSTVQREPEPEPIRESEQERASSDQEPEPESSKESEQEQEPTEQEPEPTEQEPESGPEPAKEAESEVQEEPQTLAVSDKDEENEESDREQILQEESAQGAQTEPASNELAIETEEDQPKELAEHDSDNKEPFEPTPEARTQQKNEVVDPLSTGQEEEEFDVPPIDNSPVEPLSIEPPQQLSTNEQNGEPEEEEDEDDDFGSDTESNAAEKPTSKDDAKTKLFEDLLEEPSADPLDADSKSEPPKAEPVQSPSVTSAKVSLFGADDDTEDFFSAVKTPQETPKKAETPEPVKKPVSATKVSLFGEDDDDGADFLGFLAKKT